MKAIVYSNYGSPDVLRCEDVETPTPGDYEVLVRVRAASVNPYDLHFMRGTPYLLRLGAGLRNPKVTRLGADVAGTVESVGRNVTQFRPGDDVFGMGRGTFADYVCISESALVTIAPNMTFEQAASVPLAAFTAIQGLRDKGRLQAGQKVLINGAAGGVGTFAVQIAKAMGADVTGVCGTRNADLARSIGADHVVDYTREDFTASATRYDVMLDCIGNHSLLRCRRALNREGIYVGVGGKNGRWIGPLFGMISAPLVSKFVSQTLVVLQARRNKADLTILRDLLAAGRVTPVIERCYELKEIPSALRHLEGGHARGKLVILL
jgi:NADPH:quinone reductase and related Zn-dependent oxidoreductases